MERPERDKVQHETLLLYCKRLQHQQLEYKKQIKELTFERNYSLQAFDTVVAEYEILKAEAKAYDDRLPTTKIWGCTFIVITGEIVLQEY